MTLSTLLPRWTIFCLCSSTWVACALAGTDAASRPTAARVAEIAAWLPAQPGGIGAPARDRAAWAVAAHGLPVDALLAAAKQAAAEPVPALPDELFLEYSRNGNRAHYQLPNRQRLNRLNLFAWAEALEHRGRFVPALERELAAIFEEKTWVYPAHDPDLDNFMGRAMQVDLGVATRSWVVATVLWWHADQLAPATVARGRAELRRRIIDPYLAGPTGDLPFENLWWSRFGNNWNAVCHAGVVGTALAMVESRKERAEILARAEDNLQVYLGSFGPDGYCDEGLDYWNYGFGHFAMLAEVVVNATGGHVRLLKGDHAAQIAAYPPRLEILPGIYPAFADMNPKEPTSPWFLALAERQLSPTPAGVPLPPLGLTELREQLLYVSALQVFVAEATAGLPAAVPIDPVGDHHWFSQAQVYVGRASPRFGAALKGGNNGEPHGHDDLGSLVVAAGHTALLVDPGAEVYTARTFGPHRFDSQVINSYGHAVPLVAGQLQSTGPQFAARVIATEFKPDADTVVLDLAGGYAVPTLKKLVRTFTLRRGAHPAVIVVDAVEFSEPAAFGTALITFDAWKQVAPGIYEVGAGKDRVRVAVTVEGAGWLLQPEVLREELQAGRPATRLGFNLTTPVRTATIRMTITPQ
ncbi:MAG: heparinase II/III family protein [Opitutaceae bacterium]